MRKREGARWTWEEKNAGICGTVLQAVVNMAISMFRYIIVVRGRQCVLDSSDGPSVSHSTARQQSDEESWAEED